MSKYFNSSMIPIMMRRSIRLLLTAVIFVAAGFVNASAVPGTESAPGEKRLTGPMYEILGMLSEYISRFDCYSGEPHPGLVEWFYPAEPDLVGRFERLLAAHAQITGLKKDWRKEIGKQGSVSFISSAWAKVLNSFFVRVGERWADLSPVEKNWATLNPDIFANASREDLLRFLRGAYSRYGSRNRTSAIEMANAPYKIETIAGVLKKLACAHVTIFVQGGLPRSYRVHFNPSPAVRECLKIQRTVLTPKKDNRPGEWKLFRKIL